MNVFILFLEPKRNIVKRCLCRFYHHLLPSKKELNLTITKFFFIIFFFGTLFGILNENALPGSEVFALLLLVLISCIGGKIFGIIRLPPLVGKILAIALI